MARLALDLPPRCSTFEPSYTPEAPSIVLSAASSRGVCACCCPCCMLPTTSDLRSAEESEIHRPARTRRSRLPDCLTDSPTIRPAIPQFPGRDRHFGVPSIPPDPNSLSQPTNRSGPRDTPKAPPPSSLVPRPRLSPPLLPCSSSILRVHPTPPRRSSIRSFQRASTSPPPRPARICPSQEDRFKELRG